MFNIITGMTGTAHITSDDDRAMHSAIFGNDTNPVNGALMFNYGQKFDSEILDRNTVRVKSGMLVFQGTQMGIELDDYEDVTIETGSAGRKRYDIIALHYEKNEVTGIESAELKVIKGKAETDGAVPSYDELVEGNILDGGDLVAECALLVVYINGTQIVNVSKELDEPDEKLIADYSSFKKTKTRADNAYRASVTDVEWERPRFQSSDLITSGAVYNGLESLGGYEEGTFTPQKGYDSTYKNYMFSIGTYYKVGKIVHCIFDARSTSGFLEDIEHLTFSTQNGLPFPYKRMLGGIAYMGASTNQTELKQMDTVQSIDCGNCSLAINSPAYQIAFSYIAK